MQNRITLNGKIYGDEVLSGGIDYDIDINGGNELTVGVTACGTLKFSLLADDNKFKVGDEFTWSRRQIEDNSFADLGVFAVTGVTKNRSKYTIEASDRMAKFNMVVDAWLNALSYPITHSALLSSLCAKVGVTLDSTSSLTNGDRQIASSPAWEGATGRDILGFLAEASGCFAQMLPNGRLYVGWYRQTSIALTRENYTNPFVADYVVSAIDKVQVRSSENDIGVIAGDGTNVYTIENNPLLIAKSDADLRPYVVRLLNKLSSLTYTPCEIPLYNDRGLRPGDIFTVDGVQSVVMTLRSTERGSVVSSVGSKTRPTQSGAKNRDVIALRGKMNELTRTVEETTLKISDAEGNLASLSLTVNGLSTRVSNAEGDISSLELTASGLSVTVSDHTNAISALSINANMISARVGQNELAISNLGIQMTGYVTFNALATAGQTTIDGGNITTGKISAITLEGCTLQSVNGASSISLTRNMMNFYSGGGLYGQLIITDDGRFKVTGANGYTTTLYCGDINPQVQIGSAYYDIIHAGNVGSYVGSVYAVFG